MSRNAGTQHVSRFAKAEVPATAHAHAGLPVFPGLFHATRNISSATVLTRIICVRASSHRAVASTAGQTLAAFASRSSQSAPLAAASIS